MDRAPRNPPIGEPPIRLAVCVSGEGTTLQSLIDQIAGQRLHAEIGVVVASRPRIGAIARAEAAGIPLALAQRTRRSGGGFSDSVFDPIRSARADLVILAGFLSLLKIPDDYRGRVLNVHPSLIPAFCGQGYYGRKVHQAVIESGVKVSGCTIHFVDDAYDSGPIILQRVVQVRDNDRAESLAIRVFKEECKALAEAITLYAEGRIGVQGRRVSIAPRG